MGCLKTEISALRFIIEYVIVSISIIIFTFSMASSGPLGVSHEFFIWTVIGVFLILIFPKILFSSTVIECKDPWLVTDLKGEILHIREGADKKEAEDYMKKMHGNDKI